MSEPIQKTLAGINIFENLGVWELQALENLCQWKRFSAEEFIIDQKDDGEEVFFIVNGRARVVNIARSGHEIFLETLSKGSFFGELSALDGQPRSASVIANTDILTASLSAKHFLELLRKHPSIAFMVMLRLSKIIRTETIHRNVEENLRVAKKHADIANRMKTEFLTNLSHEFRTSLNAIIGFSESIEQETFGPLGNNKYKEYVRDIRGSGKHLLDLINDILDISAIEAGKLELHEDNLDLADVAESSLRLVKAIAAKRRVGLSTRIDEDLPSVFADERRVKQILINLLSNAVKFTQKGGRVSLDACRDRNGSVLISVTDTGIGMEEKDIQVALSPFGQVECPHSEENEGTGLGLPLAMELMEAHGGSLGIKSAPNIGTTVTIRFPAERVVPLYPPS